MKMTKDEFIQALKEATRKLESARDELSALFHMTPKPFVSVEKALVDCDLFECDCEDPRCPGWRVRYHG